ncbi:MAG TPA: glycosyltransferase family 39 protein [Vicinamibacteria bacterium]
MAEARRGTGSWDLLADRGPAAGILLLHLAFLPGYGVFRDELYYMACGRRPSWGYVDHPPLVAWVAWLVAHVAGESHLALRAVAALAIAATAWLAGRIAGALGGGPFARGLSGIATGLAPVILSLGSAYSMNALDLFFWALIALLLVRALSGGGERLWLAFGAAAGIGLLNKVSVLYLGFGLAVGLVLARRWDVLRTRLFWAAGLLAAVIFLPHLAWQHATGWPTLEFMANARRYKMAPLSPPGFLAETLLHTAPAAWLWILGVAWLVLARRARRWQALGFAFLVVLAVLVIAGGKPYYLAAAYSLAFAAGAVAVEGWTSRRARFVRPVLVALVLAVSLAVAPLGKPLLPVEAYLRYAAALGIKPASGERHELGRLPQFYADMHGWREMAETVAGVVRGLPPEERAGACVFGQNYGQAGAIEYFGPPLELPPAVSGHNSYWLWGPGSCTRELVVVIGGGRERLDERFRDVRLGAVSRCRDCMPYEDGLSIWVARGAKQPLRELWPLVKHYD